MWYRQQVYYFFHTRIWITNMAARKHKQKVKCQAWAFVQSAPRSLFCYLFVFGTVVVKDDTPSQNPSVSWQHCRTINNGSMLHIQCQLRGHYNRKSMSGLGSKTNVAFLIYKKSARFDLRLHPRELACCCVLFEQLHNRLLKGLKDI